jgi:uncharacterized membrane protein YsdA (DUF1294 family)
MTTTLWIYLLGMNLLAFLIFGIDKRRAIKKEWRIPESTLLGIALVGGAVGAWTAMQVFRHKTKHWYFKYGIPVVLMVEISAILFFLR